MAQEDFNDNSHSHFDALRAIQATPFNFKGVILRNLFISFLCFIAINANAEINREWEDYSDPAIRNPNYEKSFTNLPLKGIVTDNRKIWANDYWAHKKGSINFRWNAKKPIGFDLKSPSREEALLMSQESIAELAATEKLDLLNGDYAYTLKNEVDKIANKHAAIWHGICNGWSPATINHNEPTPKTFTNADGVVIPFGSSDIKALISYYYAFHHEVRSTHQMGKRCLLVGPGCDDDLNAGAFHIVLANTLGKGESMIADVERGRQVWNHAVSEFTTTVVEANLAPGKKAAKGTVRVVRVKTDMTFVQAITKNSWYPTLGTVDHVNGIRNYEYTLELDASGRIIGGEWISKVRPDFIWEMEKATTFTGTFAKLPQLLND